MTVPLKNEVLGDGGYADEVLRDSKYARVYDLALEWTADARTPYDAVKAIETRLQEEYDYSERVPTRPLPLDGFLFEERRGYCQQFSGAMALMLRMVGVPARVAAGFSPGSYNRDTREYRVRDLDAHSWVEVYFTGIGWVPFDPTPIRAPARVAVVRDSGHERGARGRRRGRQPARGRGRVGARHRSRRPARRRRAAPAGSCRCSP